MMPVPGQFSVPLDSVQPEAIVTIPNRAGDPPLFSIRPSELPGGVFCASAGVPNKQNKNAKTFSYFRHPS